MVPEHYSRDIVQRCQSLIRNLRPSVLRGLRGDAAFGGPLGNTFLLAMATPMIVLPIERLYKPARPNADQAGDDRELDPELAQQVAGILGPMQSFGAAPFTVRGHWSYVPNQRPFNIAAAWPSALLDRLGTLDAHTAAETAPAGRILVDLRNALAHGGIAYLDANGRQSAAEASMFAFAGTKLDRRTRRIDSLNILRIGENDFCEFLMLWADWLAQQPIRHALNDRGPLAA